MVKVVKNDAVYIELSAQVNFKPRVVIFSSKGTRIRMLWERDAIYRKSCVSLVSRGNLNSRSSDCYIFCGCNQNDVDLNND